MPHLTPMSWITAMFMVWLLITMISINNWSYKPMKFTKPINKHTNKNLKHSWTWN